MIQDVEEMASRLERNAFGKSDLAAQRDIPLRSTKSAQGIASQIALRVAPDR
jgi:hypothetical protein